MSDSNEPDALGDPDEPERDLFGRASPSGTWAHRRGEPRLFALAWTGLLLVATAGALMASGMGWVFSDESFRANAQRLMIVIAVLTTMIWPMVRLSQARPACGGVPAIARDLIIVLVPTQAVIWPQALPPAAWPASVASAVSLYFAAWAVLVGAALAWALGPGRPGASLRDEAAPSDDLSAARRLTWMAIILALVLGGVGPALVDVAADASSAGVRTAWLWSPLTGAFELTRDRSWTGQLAAVDAAHWRVIGWLWIVATAAWLTPLVRAMVRRKPAA